MSLDNLRRIARAENVAPGEAVGIVMRDLRAAVAEHAALHVERDALAARLAQARRYVAEQLGHGEECPGDDEPAGACTCGHEKLLAMLAPKGDGA